MTGKTIDGASALYPVIAVTDPAATARAFQSLLPVAPVFETDWYVQLQSTDARLQLGLVRHDHDSVPQRYRTPVRGLFVTIDTDDAAGAWERVAGAAEVVHPLTDEAWGQRHFIIRVAGDVLVDVVQMLAPVDA